VAGLSALHELDLDRVEADDEGLRSLLRASMPCLRSLDIGGNQVSSAGLRSLVDASLPQLERLAARGNWFAEDSIWDILAGGFWPQLRTLDINGDGSEPEQLIRAQGLFAAMTHLNLSSCRLGDTGADALSATPFLRLESLRLAYNRIGVNGARALARAPLPDLVDLDLSVNDLGDEGLRALMEARWWHQLERLTLVNNQLTDPGVALLAERLPARIQEFDVGSPRGVGADALSRLRDALTARRGAP
jgi:Ran GTPase-activating protein (RanGAP) involved in mRNA processing and transport